MIIGEKLVKRDINGDLDCTWWRMAPNEELRYSSKAKDPPEFEPDALFKNYAAARIVEGLRGFKFCRGDRITEFHDEATILSLSRCDAFITSSMNVMKDKQMPEGNTGKLYNTGYERLLPRATETLLLKCREIVKSQCPDDLKVLTNSSSDCKSSSDLTVERGDVGFSYATNE